MAKRAEIKTIADAMSCAVKMSNGVTCTQAEMKATVRLLHGGLKTARTTAKMAKHNGRQYIGIEVNPEYCEIAEERLRQGVLF